MALKNIPCRPVLNRNFGLIRGRAGSLTLPLAGISALFAVTSLGTLGLIHQWRRLTETQLRLDRCVGKKAQQLSSLMQSIERANKRVHALRVSITAALVAAPETVPPLQALLRAQVVVQDLTLKNWDAQRLTWSLTQSCGSSRDRKKPLPDLPWFRPPPDPVGEQALSWPSSLDRRLHLQAENGSRKAAAAVADPNSTNSGVNTHALFSRSAQWTAIWTIPQQILSPMRAGSH